MPRALSLSALAVAVALTPVGAWWAIGDLSVAGPDLDRMVRPPTVDATAGMTAAVAVAAGVAIALAGWRRGRVRPGELLGAVPLIVAGVFVGFAGRVVTAGVYGANIGGGMLLLVGPFVLLALLAAAVLLWRVAP